MFNLEHICINLPTQWHFLGKTINNDFEFFKVQYEFECPMKKMVGKIKLNVLVAYYVQFSFYYL